MKTPIISATIVAALTVVGAYYWFGATVDQYPAIALWAAAIWFSLGTVLVMLQYRMAFSAGLLAGAATAFSTPWPPLAGIVAFVVGFGLARYVYLHASKWPFVSGGLQNDPELRARYPHAARQSDELIAAAKVAKDRRN